MRYIDFQKVSHTFRYIHIHLITLLLHHYWLRALRSAEVE